MLFDTVDQIRLENHEQMCVPIVLIYFERQQ